MSANVCCGVRAAWRKRVPESGEDFGNLEVCKLPQLFLSTSDLDQSLALSGEQSYSELLLRRECLDCALKTKCDLLTSPVCTPVLSHDLLNWLTLSCRRSEVRPADVYGVKGHPPSHWVNTEDEAKKE